MLFSYVFLVFNNKNINILLSKNINYFIYGFISLFSQKYYLSYMLYITFKKILIYFLSKIYFILNT